MVVCCKKCGKPLFEIVPGIKTIGHSRKIFGSFTTKFDKDNNEEYYLCYNCHVGKDVKEERKEENGKD